MSENKEAETKSKITKDMLIGDVVSKYPETAIIMMNNGMHCVGCHVAGSESIEEGSKAHGMEDEQIDLMIEEMNKSLSKIK